MRIHSIAIETFPPFAKGIIEFPPKPKGSDKAEVHLIVGPNGSGKTRLLCLLAAALGNSTELLRRKINPVSIDVAVAATDQRDMIGVWSSQLAHVNWLAHGASLHFKEWMGGNQGSSANTAPAFIEASPDAPRRALALAFNGQERLSDADVIALKSVALGKDDEHLLFDRPITDEGLIAQELSNICMRAARTGPLLAMTQHHCAFCDSHWRCPRTSDATIEHFRPKGDDRFAALAFEWTNPFPACDRCQGRKREHWDPRS
jgi:energy-coupling factor transporter ATP-binding protein EcfA2